MIGKATTATNTTQSKRGVLQTILPGAPENSTLTRILLKVMQCGPTGSGKTQNLITVPQSVERPLLLIDFDNRWETVRDQIEAGTIKLFQVYDPDPDSPKGWDRVELLRKELWAEARKGDFPFSAVAEDGLSAMARLAMNSALLTDPKRGLGGAPAKQHYIPQIAYLVKHINSLRNLPCHYILNSHFDLEKDEDDGTVKILPKVTRSLRTEIASWFNEVYRCYRVQGKGNIRYYWDTIGAGKYEFFKSTLNNLGRYWENPILLDYKNPPVGFQYILKKRFGGKEE